MAETGDPKYRVLFVLGGPGSGKGTQCQRVATNCNLNSPASIRYIHLSAGDLLRAERMSGSSHGDMINECIKNGKIVASEITVNLLEKAMLDQGADPVFLIDGFPRNVGNLECWVRDMKNKTKVVGVLFFDCPEDVCVERILKRGKESGRVDDNVESLRKRFQTYYDETMPVVKYYEKEGLLKKVDATPHAQEVFESVQEYLREIFS